MKFKAFLLDQWLQQHADTAFDLGHSTGPRWTARELLALAGDSDDAAQRMLDFTFWSAARPRRLLGLSRPLPYRVRRGPRVVPERHGTFLRPHPRVDECDALEGPQQCSSARLKGRLYDP